jgi:hypothetical protein
MQHKNSNFKRLAKKAINRLGIDVTRLSREDLTPPPMEKFPRDFSEVDIDTVRRVRGFTMTSLDRIVTAIHATEYVVLNEIPGSIVECGVWRGG